MDETFPLTSIRMTRNGNFFKESLSKCWRRGEFSKARKRSKKIVERFVVFGPQKICSRLFSLVEMENGCDCNLLYKMNGFCFFFVTYS